jgi:hypothetical protein
VGKRSVFEEKKGKVSREEEKVDMSVNNYVHSIITPF